MIWLYNGVSGFGAMDIKREGAKIGPATFLTFYGYWPEPEIYSKEELEQLKRDGWEPSEAPCS